MSKKKEWVCCICNNIFYKYESQMRNLEYPCCGKKCSNAHRSLHHCGENNNNYGKHWDDTKKEKQSKTIKTILDNDDIRYKCGNANRGKTFNDDVRYNMSVAQRGENNPMYGKHHSSMSKLKISEASASKFTDEYKASHKQTMIDMGFWVDDCDRSDVDVYNALSNWVDSMFNDKNILGYPLINEYGVFNIYLNTKGVVRDHRVSRFDGFNNKLFPEILRHPCNCQIILHRDNVSKRSKSSISIDMLFNNIIEYHGDWFEHDLCLELIRKYKIGERWERN